MKIIKRVTIFILLLVVVFPAIAISGVAAWLKWSVPPYSETASGTATSAPVDLTFDNDAIPLIEAESLDDAYYALGYIHARERLWQMESQRRVGQGRMAELVGSPALPFDRYMRTLGIYAQAEAAYDYLDEQTRSALDAYAQGVNYYLNDRRDPLPLEFQLLWHSPEPWTPADSIVWGKLMALQLSGNYRHELLRARMLDRVDRGQIDDLFPGYQPDDPTTLPDPEGDDVTSVDWDRIQAAAPGLPGINSASNVWALAGEHTESGQPLLANDPHLSLNAPILWYLARIETPEATLTGATVPGVPFHLVGHNGTMAWGVTTTGADVQDLFIQRVDPETPDRYLTPDGSEPFTIREETIRVRFGDDETLRVRETRHGPIISDLGGDVSAIGTDDRPVAFAFTALRDDDLGAAAFRRATLATSWQDFVDALEDFPGPMQNFAYADTAGDIGLIAPADVPMRASGDGRFPVPGWTGEHDWVGVIPYDELPRIHNPESGRIVNANNRLVGDDFPHLITTDWDAPFRAERIEQMLDAGEPHSLDSAERMIMDNVSLAARHALDAMLTVEPRSEQAQDALALLRDWDGTKTRDRPEPLIFGLWLRELNRELYADALGGLFRDFSRLNVRTTLHLLNNARHWCRGSHPDAGQAGSDTHPCQESLAASLEAALDVLEEDFGEIGTVRWGDVHQAPFRHQILGMIPGLRDLFDIGIETDGGEYTVNRGAYYSVYGDQPFAHRHGAGFRGLYDLSDLDRSRFIIATGQSGNPLSAHYDRFVERWRDGEHVTIDGDAESRLSDGLGRITLVPGD